MSHPEPTPPERTQSVKILTAALEAAKQGKITNLALLTFDADGVHHRSRVDSLPLETAAVQRVVTEI